MNSKLLKKEIRGYLPKYTRFTKVYERDNKCYMWVAKLNNIIYGRWRTLKEAHKELAENHW